MKRFYAAFMTMESLRVPDNPIQKRLLIGCVCVRVCVCVDACRNGRAAWQSSGSQASPKDPPQSKHHCFMAECRPSSLHIHRGQLPGPSPGIPASTEAQFSQKGVEGSLLTHMHPALCSKQLTVTHNARYKATGIIVFYGLGHRGSQSVGCDPLGLNDLFTGTT